MQLFKGVQPKVGGKMSLKPACSIAEAVGQKGIAELYQHHQYRNGRKAFQIAGLQKMVDEVHVQKGCKQLHQPQRHAGAKNQRKKLHVIAGTPQNRFPCGKLDLLGGIILFVHWIHSFR